MSCNSLKPGIMRNSISFKCIFIDKWHLSFKSMQSTSAYHRVNKPAKRYPKWQKTNKLEPPGCRNLFQKRKFYKAPLGSWSRAED